MWIQPPLNSLPELSISCGAQLCNETAICKEKQSAITKAKDFNLSCLDISQASLSGHLVDSAHPAFSGMKVVAEKVIEELNKIA